MVFDIEMLAKVLAKVKRKEGRNQMLKAQKQWNQITQNRT